MKSQVDKSKRNLNPTVAKEEEEQSRRPLITFQETCVVLEGAKRGPSWQSCKNVKYFLACLGLSEKLCDASQKHHCTVTQFQLHGSFVLKGKGHRFDLQHTFALSGHRL